MADQGNRWVVAIAGMVLMLCAGAVYIWGVYQGPLVQMFGWTQTTAAATFSFTLGIFGIGTVIGGRIQDQYGPRQIATIGGLLTGLGVFLASFVTADKPWVLYLTYGIMMGLGVGIMYTPVIACCVKWFPDKRGTITGLVVASLGAGGLVFTPIAKQLIASKGVLGTFATFGVLFGVLMIAAAQLLKNPPAGYKPAGWTPPAPAPGTTTAGGRDYTPAEMVATPQFWMLAGILFIGCSAGLMVIPFGKVLAQQAGLSDAIATTAIMLISVCNSLGRFLWGAVSDMIGRVRTLLVLLVVSCATMFVLNALPGWTSLVGIAIVALCYGGYLGTFPATTADFFGPKNAGTNYGILLLFFSAAAVLSPIIAGRVKDITGNFQNAFYVAAIAALVGLVIAYVLKPPTEKQSA
jgi:OFA family oxalate/formate antiporter-like MFS transporter